jgi:hypothetical protein
MPMTAQSGKPVVGIILAGGRGSRLAPLAAEFEKPVFPVDDLPLISHADRFAREFGVAKLIVVVSPVNASRIERNVDDALFVRQEVPTGFINALRLGTTIAQCHMWSDTSVLVLCSDNVFRPDGAWFRAAVAASGSEPGTAWGEAAYDLGARSLERALMRAGAVTVLCVPDDQEAQIAEHARRRAAGAEEFASIRRVVAAYADLRRGNLAVPGDGYLQQLTRYGDYAARPDVLTYDIATDGRDVGRFCARVLRRVQAMRAGQSVAALYQWDFAFAGNLTTAGFAFVVNTPSPSSCDLSMLPGCDGDDSPVSAELAAIGFDETNAVWCRGRRGNAGLVAMVERGMPLVCLGVDAAKAAHQNGRIAGIAFDPSPLDLGAAIRRAKEMGR